MEFLGSFVRADLVSDATGEDPLLADVSINFVRSHDLKVGDNVTVKVPRERIRVYPGRPRHE